MWRERLTNKRFFAPVVFFLTVMVILVFTTSAVGMSFSIQSQSIQIDNTAQLDVFVTNLGQGFGDASVGIKLGTPKVAEIVGVQAKAVPGSFLHIAEQTADRAKLKIIDLRNQIKKGDNEVLLFTVKVRGVKAGKSSIEFFKLTATNEQGSVATTSYTAGTLTVEAEQNQPPIDQEQTATDNQPPSQPQTSSDQRTGGTSDKVPSRSANQASEPDTGNDSQSPTQFGSTKSQTDSEQSVDERAIPSVSDQAYNVFLETTQLQFGEPEKLIFSIRDMTDGFQQAEFIIEFPTGLDLLRNKTLTDLYVHFRKVGIRRYSVQIADFDDVVTVGTTQHPIIKLEVLPKTRGTLLVKYELSLQTDNGAALKRTKKVRFKVTPGVIGNSWGPPQDLDDDGLYEDVNGDNQLTTTDAFVLVFNRDSNPVQNNKKLFDFNEDGEVSFGDGAALMKEIKN